MDEDELIIIWSSKIKIIKASQNFQNHKKFLHKKLIEKKWSDVRVSS